jgi:hypothetical protein
MRREATQTEMAAMRLDHPRQRLEDPGIVSVLLLHRRL